ncbi:TenA family protein [Coleofasciculus chthonoplastes]|uniref:TenA family protein n=1 Tax=Coleofasciculus chthonoplastes TaxID=64178 RepID=UPI0032F2016C
MTLSSDLWKSNQALVQECLEHPFVQGIATGTLERRKFAYYVGQDAFFLEAFARAYSIAAAKCPDWDGFNTFHNLASGVLEELSLHQNYATAWGVNLHQIEPAIATRRYTDFLLATAWGSEIGLITVAMTPCMRLYAFLGQELAKDGIPEHTYTDWIRTYNNPGFKQLAQQLEQLTDQYAQLSAAVKSSYRYAMLCERDFFHSAWES